MAYLSVGKAKLMSEAMRDVDGNKSISTMWDI